MGTWTTFYVEGEHAAVVSACKRWLSTTKADVTETCGPFPDIRFHLSGRSPRSLAIGQQNPSWCEVHYDGFYRPNLAAEEVSRTLQTTVVDTVAQTTSDCYELSVYQSGTLRRRLEFQEYEWVTQEGTPLPNEPDPLVTHDEEDMCYFHHEEMGRYCEAVFGFEFWRDTSEIGEWVALKRKRRGLFGFLRGDS